MLGLAAGAARSNQFDETTLRLSLAEIAQRPCGNGATVNRAMEEGWKLGVGHAMAYGIMTQAEESKLRKFRDRLALDSSTADIDLLEPQRSAAEQGREDQDEEVS